MSRELNFGPYVDVENGKKVVKDLTFGNPHDFPLPGVVGAIREHAVPRDKDWFAYKRSEPEPQAFLAEVLRGELKLPFVPPPERARLQRLTAYLEDKIRRYQVGAEEVYLNVPPAIARHFCFKNLAGAP